VTFGMTEIVDLHVHSSPSVLPRRQTDDETAKSTEASGVARFVLKAHEGSSAERAALIGPRAVGGIVLNSTVGGANPDAVEVATTLGARVVWLPTVSSDAHRAAAKQSSSLRVHRGFTLRRVRVVEDGLLAPEWYEVFEVIAANDMVLASGHVPVAEALVAFRAAYSLGVRRFVVNHPLFDFMAWSPEMVDPLRALAARLEVGCVADLTSNATAKLAQIYDRALLVFGSDLGHVEYPEYQEGIGDWVRRVIPELGEPTVQQIMTTNGREVIDR
jgi:Family of unknown function (DUF6282)